MIQRLDRCPECQGLEIIRASVAGEEQWFSRLQLAHLRFAPDWIGERRVLHAATCSRQVREALGVI